MKKKGIALLLTAVLGLGLVSGCGSSTQERSSSAAAEASGSSAKESITVINYGEYIEPALLKQFEKETGIHVKYEEATTPEELYSKYSAGGIDYDLLCTSDYMIERLIQEGQALKLDYEQMPNMKNIGDTYWKLSESFDPGNVYSVPYFWGTVGILYNTKIIKEPVDSWSILFDGKYPNDIIMQNSIRDAFMVAEKYLGYSLNTTDETQIRKAHNLLIDQKKDVQAYFVDEVREEMVAENAGLAVCYSGEAYLGHEYNENLEYVVPKEGSNIWIDSWIMPKTSKNQSGAMKFLDFLARADVAMENFDYVYYPTPNEAVLSQLDDEIRNDPLLFPSEEAMENCEVYKQVDDGTTELYNYLWKLLKAE